MCVRELCVCVLCICVVCCVMMMMMITEVLQPKQYKVLSLMTSNCCCAADGFTRVERTPEERKEDTCVCCVVCVGEEFNGVEVCCCQAS